MRKANFFQRAVAFLIDAGMIWLLCFALNRFILGLPLLLLYETVLITKAGGATLGKRVMGLRVVTAEGKAPEPIPSFIRALGKILSEIVFFLGLFWMLWDKDSQTWHDKLAATYVQRD